MPPSAATRPDSRAVPWPAPETSADDRERYARFVRPRVAQMMRAVRLDVVYEQADGDWLAYRDDHGSEIRVLDMLGGYGSTFFGHNHPQLCEALIGSVREARPFAAQASVRAGAARLAQRLSALFEARVGVPAVVTFGNSGAEAVEAARKHAALEHAQRRQRDLAALRRSLRQLGERIDAGALGLPERVPAEVLAGTPGEDRAAAGADAGWPAIEQALLRGAERALTQPARLLALSGGFHGKTRGALALTHGAHHREPFGDADSSVQFIDPFADDAQERLRAIVDAHCHDYPVALASAGELRFSSARTCSLAALFFEPVQGEGGIRVVPSPFLKLARELADVHGFALVADEIQSGMGRSGRVLATEHHDVAPDYVLLGKSLGGGLVKLGALLVRADRYVNEFGLLHSSTFAEDEHSARVALRALDLLDEDRLAAAAARRGADLLARLEALCERYPHAFIQARGCGLLLGLELRDLSFSQAPLARALSRQGLIGYLAAGFLLHHGRTRVAPSLSNPHTLRLEPSAYVGEAEIAHLMRALHTLGRVLENQDYGALLEYTTLDSRPAAHEPVRTRSFAVRPVTFHLDGAVQPVRRVAFLGHFIHLDDLPRWEPSLARLSAQSRRVLLERVAPLIDPHPILERRVHGNNGEAIDFVFIGLTHDSAGIESAMRARALEPLVQEIQGAVELAEQIGCEVIGLGGYTSIVTRNGKALATRRATLTTGNSLTAAMTIEALLAAADDAGIDLAGAKLGVLGAGGNIGQLLTRALAPRVARVVLVGRPGRLAALHELASELDAEHGRETHVTDGVGALADADLVIGASNSAGEPLGEVGFADLPRVVCDVAVPPDAPADMAQRLPRTRVVMGGLVSVPGAPDFGVPGVPLAPGRIFACMAETMTLGLCPGLKPARLGQLEPETVKRIAQAARHAGLRLAETKAARSF